MRAGEQSRDGRNANPVAAKGGYGVRNGARHGVYRHDDPRDDFLFRSPVYVKGEADIAIQNFDLSDVGNVGIENRTRLDHCDLTHHATPRLRPRAGMELFHGINSSSNHDESCAVRSAASYSCPNGITVRLLTDRSRRDPAHIPPVRQLAGEQSSAFLFLISHRKIQPEQSSKDCRGKPDCEADVVETPFHVLSLSSSRAAMAHNFSDERSSEFLFGQLPSQWATPCRRVRGGENTATNSEFVRRTMPHWFAGPPMVAVSVRPTKEMDTDWRRASPTIPHEANSRFERERPDGTGILIPALSLHRGAAMNQISIGGHTPGKDASALSQKAAALRYWDLTRSGVASGQEFFANGANRD